jgi:hypothetical protein
MTRSTVGPRTRLARSLVLACALVTLGCASCKKHHVTCTAEVVDGARSAKASASAEPKADGSPPDGLERAAERAACRALCEQSAERAAQGLEACVARCGADIVANKLGARVTCGGAP